MRQQYFDAYDLRFIDELANEMRKLTDTTDLFEARRRQIFDLYAAGIQSRDEILRAMRSRV